MERMNFTFELNEEQQKYKDELYHKLIQNGKVTSFLKEHDLKEEVVYQHTEKFNTWIQTINKCVGCKGLLFCKQPSRGQLLSLRAKPYLDFVLSDCFYLKEEKNALSHINHYVYKDLSTEQLKINFKMIENKNESSEYIEILLNLKKALKEKEITGYYLSGAPGVGKTFLLTCAANELARQKRKVAFVNVPTLMNDVKMLMNQKDALEKRLRVVRKAEILMLDDIGGEMVTTWCRDEILLPLLNERMEAGRTTYFTSNYKVDELEEYYSMNSKGMMDQVAAKRIVERIKALSMEETLKGMSRRVTKTSK